MEDKFGYNIAKYFLYLYKKDRNKGDKSHLNPLKLQKMLWYFNMFYFKKNYKKKFYFDNMIFQAWKYGPVIPEIWQSYRYDKTFFTENNIEIIKERIDNELIQIIKYVYNKIKDVDEYTLFENTHRELSDIYDDENYNYYDNTYITNNDIKKAMLRNEN